MTTTVMIGNDDIFLLLSLTGVGVCCRVGLVLLEEKIAQAAGVSADQVSIVEEFDDGEDDGGGDDNNRVLFVVFGCDQSTTDELIERINNTDNGWICAVADTEEEFEVDDDEAYTIWKTMTDEERTCHLQLVCDPDGELVQPKHHNTTKLDDEDEDVDGPNEENDEHDEQDPTTSLSAKPTALQQQLQRDPQLLEFDNVKRIHISKLKDSTTTINWEEPFVITGLVVIDDAGDDDYGSSVLSKANLLETIGGDTIVRTGNRNTLIESGFDNSLPLTLSEALLLDGKRRQTDGSGGSGCTIIFTPLAELPESFQQNKTLLKAILSRFPKFHSQRHQQPPQPQPQPQNGENNDDSDDRDDEAAAFHHKYTLCVSNSVGFGIGMHKHNEAYFYLLEGCKKWYMSDGKYTLDGRSNPPTHPQFYTTESTHKCLQHSGEILFVPNSWYHEIFNVSQYTAGIQALPL